MDCRTHYCFVFQLPVSPRKAQQLPRSPAASPSTAASAAARRPRRLFQFQHRGKQATTASRHSLEKTGMTPKPLLLHLQTSQSFLGQSETHLENSLRYFFNVWWRFSLVNREFRFTCEVPIRLDYHGKHVSMDQVHVLNGEFMNPRYIPGLVWLTAGLLCFQGTFAGIIFGLTQLNCSELKLRQLCYRQGYNILSYCS